MTDSVVDCKAEVKQATKYVKETENVAEKYSALTVSKNSSDVNMNVGEMPSAAFTAVPTLKSVKKVRDAAPEAMLTGLGPQSAQTEYRVLYSPWYNIFVSKFLSRDGDGLCDNGCDAAATAASAVWPPSHSGIPADKYIFTVQSSHIQAKHQWKRGHKRLHCLGCLIIGLTVLLLGGETTYNFSLEPPPKLDYIFLYRLCIYFVVPTSC